MEAVKFIEIKVMTARPSITELRPPGGTMELASPVYVRRKTDDQAEALIGKQGGVTGTIKGPRQIGKSSLLVRALERAVNVGKQTVLVDFQMFDSTSLATSTSFYKVFLGAIARQMNIEVDLEKYWKKQYGNNELCTRFLREFILPSAPSGLVLGMDEVDCIAEKDFSRDFFGMVRYWHNTRGRALPRNIDLLLVTSTEPYRFIRNLDQSPFNVGEQMTVCDFNGAEASQLNQLVGSPLDSVHETGFYRLLGGHPFLTHLALYCIASQLSTADQLLDEQGWDTGPFGDHLRIFQYQLFENPDLRKALQMVLLRKRCPLEPFHRLSGMGLVIGTPENAQLRCELYRRYYSEHFRE